MASYIKFKKENKVLFIKGKHGGTWGIMSGWKSKKGIMKSLFLVGISTACLVITIGIVDSYTIFSRNITTGTTVVEQDLRGSENYILQIRIWPLGGGDTGANMTAMFYLDDVLMETVNCTYLDASIAYRSYTIGINLTADAHFKLVITNILGNDVMVSVYRGDRYHYTSYIPRFVDTIFLLMIFAVAFITILTVILVLRMRFPKFDVFVPLNPNESNAPTREFAFAIDVVYWGLIAGLPLATLASSLYGTASFTVLSILGLVIFVTCSILLFTSFIFFTKKQIRSGKIKLSSQISIGVILAMTCITSGIQMISSLHSWSEGDWILPNPDYMILVAGHYLTLSLLILLINVILAVGIVYGRKTSLKKQDQSPQE